MLKTLRKKGVAKKVIWAVAIVIIISFGFFGTAYLITGQGRTNYAGVMFGRKIPVDDFNKFFQSVRIQAIRQYGYKLNEIAHILNLEGQTWNRMILLHEAKKRKIKVPNDQVVQVINGDTSFERNNRFDPLLYNAILKNLRIRPRDYEENVRDNLKIAELFRQVTSSVTLTEEEVLKEYQNRNEKIQTSYVFISSDSSKEDVSLDASQIEQYFQDNKDDFLVPPTVNVQYLTFDFPEPEEEIEPSETDTTADDAEQETELEQKKDIIRDQADAVFNEILTTSDMAEIAAKNNLPVHTSGFFSMEQPNLTLGWSYDLFKKIFQMDIDEVNEPFETSNGLLILQIKEKRESYVPEFSEAQDKVRDALIDQKAKEIAKQKAESYLIAIQEELDKSKVRDFPKAAKVLGLEIHQTPMFTRGQYLPKIGISKEFQEAAFRLTEDNKISNVAETEKGYCILHLDNTIPVEMSEYENAKEELAQALSDEKRQGVFGDFVVQLRQEAALVDTISQLRSQAQ